MAQKNMHSVNAELLALRELCNKLPHALETKGRDLAKIREFLTKNNVDPAQDDDNLSEPLDENAGCKLVEEMTANYDLLKEYNTESKELRAQLDRKMQTFNEAKAAAGPSAQNVQLAPEITNMALLALVSRVGSVDAIRELSTEHKNVLFNEELNRYKLSQVGVVPNTQTVLNPDLASQMIAEGRELNEKRHRDALHDAESKTSGVKGQLREANLAIKEHTEELAKQMEALERVSISESNLNTRVVDLETELETTTGSLTARVTHLEQQIQDEREDHDKEKSGLEQHVQRLQVNLNRVELEKSDLEKAESTLQKKLEGAHGMIDLNKDRANALRADVFKAETRAKRAETDNRSLQDSLERIKSSLQESKDLLEKSKADSLMMTEVHREEVKKLKVSLDKSRAFLKETESALDKRGTVLKKTTESLEETKTLVKEKDIALKQSDIALGNTKTSLEEINASLEQVKADASSMANAHDEEVNRLNASIQTKNKALDDSTHERSRLGDEINHLKSEKHALHQSFEEHKASASRQAEELKGVMMWLLHMGHGKASRLEADTSRQTGILKGQIDRLQQGYDRKVSELQTSRDDVSLLENEKDTLEQSSQQYKSDMFRQAEDSYRVMRWLLHMAQGRASRLENEKGTMQQSFDLYKADASRRANDSDDVIGLLQMAFQDKDEELREKSDALTELQADYSTASEQLIALRRSLALKEREIRTADLRASNQTRNFDNQKRHTDKWHEREIRKLKERHEEFTNSLFEIMGTMCDKAVLDKVDAQLIEVQSARDALEADFQAQEKAGIATFSSLVSAVVGLEDRPFCESVWPQIISSGPTSSPTLPLAEKDVPWTVTGPWDSDSLEPESLALGSTDTMIATLYVCVQRRHWTKGAVRVLAQLTERLASQNDPVRVDAAITVMTDFVQDIPSPTIPVLGMWQLARVLELRFPDRQDILGIPEMINHATIDDFDPGHRVQLHEVLKAFESL